MPPHGGDFIGSTHSHNPEFPEDDWNLYSFLVPEETVGNTLTLLIYIVFLKVVFFLKLMCNIIVSALQAMNVTQPLDAIGVFKPHALRLTEEPKLISDADEEIIITAVFTSPGMNGCIAF